MKLRISTFLVLGLAAGAGLLLFQTSQDVQRAEDQLDRLRQMLGKEQETVRVLETEWDYLNRPDRIEQLARQHLKMAAPAPAALLGDSRNVMEPGAIPIPMRKPVLKAMPAVLVQQQENTAPVAEAVRSPDTPPMPAPVTNDARQQFQDLMETLTSQEPASGGGQ